MVQSLVSLAERALALTKHFEGFVLLVARLTVGVLFFSTGWGKVHNLEKVAGYFHELGIPAAGFNAVLASFSELICGTLLVIGLLSRLATVPLIITMIVALLTAKHGDVHSLPDLFGLVEWTYIPILLVIAVFGPGVASVDAFVVRWFGARSGGARSSIASHHPQPGHP
jgi:putative oxidoreductase